MKITDLLPTTWNPWEAIVNLNRGFSLGSSQALSDFFILLTIYLAAGSLVWALLSTVRSWRLTRRYIGRLNEIKDYSTVRQSLGRDTAFEFFQEFNHHLIDFPRQDGTGQMVLQRSVDAEDVFTDDRFAPGLSSNRIFQAMPGILTGLGVLGTFVGLQLGIGGLDLHDLKKLESSIVPLIQGCAVAFSTSVWGVGASIVFSFLEKSLEGLALGQVRELQQVVNKLVPRYVPEEAMAELARSSRSSEDMLKGLAVAIGDEMQKAIGRLGAEIKDAVVSATREGHGPLAEQSAQLLSSAITAELHKLKETIDGMGQRFSHEFSVVSSELTRQVEAFGPTISSLAQSVASSNEAVSNAVTKLNAHEAVMASIGVASDKILQASESFASMNGTLDTCSRTNKDAAEAQSEAARVNQEVAAKFGAVGEGLPEVRQTIEDAARVIGSLGGPIAELQTLLAKQPELQQQLDGLRAASEEERSTRLLSLSKDLAATVGKAVEEFGKVGDISQQLQKASSSLEMASTELAFFGQQVLQASQEQREASEASRDAANASRETTDALKPLPMAFTQVSSGLSLAGNCLREGADSAAETYDRVIDFQRQWFRGFEIGLIEMRDRIESIISTYGSQVEGQTQKLMDQWTKEVTDCLGQYDVQVQTLEASLEEFQSAFSRYSSES